VKKNAGVLTVVAALLAIFGISSLPQNPSRGPATTGSENGTKSSAKASGGGSIPYSPCEQIQERLQPYVTATPQQKWKLPDFCYANPKSADYPKLAAYDMDFVIATVPNPISTHLPLFLDRSIEIIQQAAQDNNYSYDSSWLPWDEPKEYGRLSDQLAAGEAQDFQEEQPGVLVFRKQPTKTDEPAPKGGLAVFVVSELPTGGINSEQFDNALVWIRQLGGLSPDRGLKILGPTFSGSLPSLYQSLHLPELSSFRDKQKISVSSGSVSSDFYYKWFKTQLVNEKLGTFDTAMEGDCVLIERFLKYIGLQKYKTDRVAVLSEDETAFGGRVPETSKDLSEGVCAYNDAPTYLYYPRDIATLRSAYEQQSIFGSAKPPSSTSGVTTTLRGDLSEPANVEHDTVRSYGGQLTPLAQESVLLAITEVLKEKKIQFVILRSTNSLDQIFLSQFLRRSFPEGRIVIDGADLLFRRGAEGSSLRGVMVLSTYPLLTSQQDWTSSLPSENGKNGRNYRIFGEDAAEGLYIAARGLFPDQGSSVGIANYAPPAWALSPENDEEDRRPATWLTVIGHRDFWPVAVLNSHTLRSGNPSATLPPSPALNGKSISIDGDPHPMRLLPAEFWILLILCLAWSVVHQLWCARGSISPLPSPFRLAYFAPVPRWQHPALIGFGSVLIAAVAIVVAGDSGLLRWELGVWNPVVAAMVLAIFLLACFACWRNYRLPPMADDIFTDHDSTVCRRVSARSSVLFLAALMLLQLRLILQLTTANRIPAFWRSVHLSSGVSPLLPQLFLVVGMYWWFWFCLRGLALFGNDRPLLPKQSDLKLADGTPTMPMFSREQSGTPAEDQALPIGRPYLVLLGFIFPIVLMICAVVLRGPWLRTFGEQTFGIFIFVWLTVCIALILADTAQAWSTWRRLRVLLIYLDRLPLRRTLNALQGLSWRSVWAMSGDVLTERYSLISRQIEALRHLENQIDAWIPNNLRDARNQTDLLKRITDFQRVKTRALVDWYLNLDGKPVASVEPLREVQEEIASIAAFVLGTVLIPSWQTETDSLIFDRSRPIDMEGENSSGPAISLKISPHVLAAEEFFVLPYVGFIQNILGRIRSIVLGSLFLFVATTLAVSSYPFDPLPTLGGIFLAVFTITGATMIVIYAGMHRDAALSYITGTRPGELGVAFWRQLIAFGVGPLLGLLTTLFPSITDFVSSWLQPSSDFIK
jgi:hypothetical protein